jgi:hypothetical protein
MQCHRCGKPYKPWTVRGLTVQNTGPQCARILNLVPTGRRKPRRVRKDVAQIELELTA